MRLEANVSTEIIRYTEVYWEIDRPHARRRVLDAMFLAPSTGFEWTTQGYLVNEERDAVITERAQRYGNIKCDTFVDIAWLEEHPVKGRRGTWVPTPISETCNLFKIPDNVAPDYLEAAYEIAQQSYVYLKTYDLTNYPTRVSVKKNARVD